MPAPKRTAGKSPAKSPTKSSAKPAAKAAATRPAAGAATKVHATPGADPALELFGRAVAATQQQRYREAAVLFRQLLQDTDDDPTLADRARQYLSLCEQRLTNGKESHDDDPYLQAVVAKNRGDFAAALALCRRGGRHRRDERMAYLAASILALEGEIAEAAELLALAVDQNARNRVQAFHDSDFAEVLGRAEFAFVLDPS
ncbi:MAG: hypothetical protein ABIV06_05125 [Thermoanaerobaculia bacterium]